MASIIIAKNGTKQETRAHSGQIYISIGSTLAPSNYWINNINRKWQYADGVHLSIDLL